MSLMTDEEFAAFCKAKYCSPTAGLEGGKRIQMLEELARLVAPLLAMNLGEPGWSPLRRAVAELDQDNVRVDRLEKEYDKEFAESLERSRWSKGSR